MSDLRKKAEALYKRKQVDHSDLSDLELQKLIEELQVHQIELQVQNEELRDSREENEAAKKKYFNLFDLAPIGYMVLDDKGIIAESNLKATEIFGRRKEYMFNKPFVSFLDATSMSRFYEYFEYAKHNRLHEEFELLIQKKKAKRHLQITINLFEKNQFLIVFSDITEKKQTEQELKSSEERFRSLINSTSDIVYTLDTNQIHTGIYGDWAEKVGLTKEYFLGKTTRELMGDEADVHIQANIRALKGETITYEWQSLQDDQERYYQTSLSPLTNNGDIIGLIGVGRDISMLKKTEQLLLEKNTSLELAMQAGNMAWWVMEYPKGTIRFDDKKAEMLGYPPDKFKHYEDFMSLVHPDDSEKAMDAMRKHLSGELNIYECEYRILAKNGEYIWYYDVGAIVEKSEIGQVKQICGIAININERKQTEFDFISAIENAERNRLEVQNQKAIISLNNDRLESLLRISQLKTNSIQEVLDFALEEAIKLTASEIGYIYFYDEKTKKFKLNTWSKQVMKDCEVMNPQTVYDLDDTGCWGEAVRQRKPIVINDYSAENPYKKGMPQGHVALKNFLTIPVIIDNEIVAVSGVANKETDYNKTDIRQLKLLMDSVWKISERITLIDKLNITNQKLRKSEVELKELNATKDKFFRIIAHDLRNPFSNIIGLSNLLVDNIDRYESDKIKTFIQSISQTSQNTFKLLENLLDWSGSQSGLQTMIFDTYKLKNLVDDIVVLIENAALKKGISISSKISEDISIHGDKNMINTVLRNLCSNAIKFTHANGTVEISAVTLNNEIEVSVSDTGLGMGRDTINKLFKITEKVSTVGTENEKGTGLGLILCKEFVEKHQGNIWVESELGKGSIFKFTIPHKKY